MRWPPAHQHVLLRGGTVVTMDAGGAVMEADVLISGGVIAEIGTNLSTPPATRLLDVTGCAVLPGFIQGHTHLGQALFRGLAEERSLLPWLRERIWPLEAAHSEESAYWSAMVGITDSLLGGTTTVNDMGLPRHTGALARAVYDTGIRAVIGPCLMDQGEHVPRELLQDCRSALDGVEGLTWNSPLMEPSLCPRFLLSCSEELWRGCVDLHRRLGFPIHTHLLESREETEAVRNALGRGQMEALHSWGVLDTNPRFAHGVWFDAQAAEVLSGRPASIVHCPGANLKLGSGIADLDYLSSMKNVSLGIGCDGAACNNTMDVLSEMRLAALLQSHRHGPGTVSAQQVLAMATAEGARALGKGRQLGSLEPGKQGDVVVVDWSASQTLVHDTVDVYDRIVYSCTRNQIAWVLVNGEILVQRGEFPLIEYSEVMEKAKAELSALMERASL